MHAAIGRTDLLAENDGFRIRPCAVALLVALVVSAICAQALPGASFDREPRIRAVRAKADAFVSGANMAKNFGGARDLRLDASPTFRAFVRFNVDVRSGDVQRINLLLFSRTRSKAGYQVRLVEEPWRETQITFLNAPSLSPDFIISGPLKARAWKAVDVTSLVEEASGSEDDVSFALTTRSRNAVELASRETGLHGPRLVVERDGGHRRGGQPGLPTPPDDQLN
jgi:hypothetical protein